jgi:hypothetical protein
VCILVLLLHLQFREVYTKTLPRQFFVKTQSTPTQTDTTILSVYSLSLVTIITGHLILTKNSKNERFVHFFERERQSDSPRKTSTLRCQMQAQRPTFYIDCRKIAILELCCLSNNSGLLNGSICSNSFRVLLNSSSLCSLKF